MSADLMLLCPDPTPDRDLGNPYHGADGKFTSKSGAGRGGSQRAGKTGSGIGYTTRDGPEGQWGQGPPVRKPSAGRPEGEPRFDKDGYLLQPGEGPGPKAIRQPKGGGEGKKWAKGGTKPGSDGSPENGLAARAQRIEVMAHGDRVIKAVRKAGLKADSREVLFNGMLIDDTDSVAPEDNFAIRGPRAYAIARKTLASDGWREKPIPKTKQAVRFEKGGIHALVSDYGTNFGILPQAELRSRFRISCPTGRIKLKAEVAPCPTRRLRYRLSRQFRPGSGRCCNE